MLELTRNEKLDLGAAIQEEMGDVFYHPWEWEKWTDLAIEEEGQKRALNAAAGALKWLGKRKTGAKEWAPKGKFHLKWSKRHRIGLGSAILIQMGDIFYEPWEWPDSPPPEGFDTWTEEAKGVYERDTALAAAEGALKWISTYLGRTQRS